MLKARDIIIAIWKKYNGNWERIYQAIANKEEIDAEEFLKDIDTNNYVTLLDDEYPQDIKQSYKPPFVLIKQ